MAGIDDYYALIGVAPDADRDAIREAYRSRRDALATKDPDASRAEISRLNRAWNVLSDPIQRERYDEELAAARAEGSDGAGSAPEEGEPDGDRGVRPRRRRLFEPAERGPAARAAAPPPTVTLPGGLRAADRRDRVMAMLIDLTVVIALGLGMQLGGGRIIERMFPDEVDRLDVLADDLDAAEEGADAASERVDRAEDAVAEAEEQGDERDLEEARTALRRARAAEEDADAEVEAIEDEARDVQGDLLPANLALFAAPIVVGFLYLALPSGRTGQTLGKRLRRVTVVRTDGSRLGWGGAAVRYGVPALFTGALWLVLGPLSFALALFGVLTWLRRPGQQGMHDRMAKTVVVAADSTTG